MELGDFFPLEAIVPSLRANSKKQVLLELAARAGSVTGLSDRAIFDALVQRERLGTTGVGHGIAIPHAEVPGLTQMIGVFARMERPIDFGATDDQTVDLIFVLLTPIGYGADHLKALAMIARALQDVRLTAKLRATSDPAALWALLAHAENSSDAA
ncbi:transcriptional regulator [Siculibacillus lacustris]|uniref:Transcriptional regulator n=1 Tax=Siculibacillus lacustris TaxID=1549641 RepID=A0A4Q9VYM3_9HYPH|nr:PTS sugar transporter subunit IIA [Siculibacillus lacustris]TBW41261.1 transcriptional regulator [Siculibacillus lacustris]